MLYTNGNGSITCKNDINFTQHIFSAVEVSRIILNLKKNVLEGKSLLFSWNYLEDNTVLHSVTM